jgi:tyrosinase
MSGDSKFALPFWNYEASTQRYLPVPFRASGTGLYATDTDRGTGWNSGTSYLLPSAVSVAGCMPEKPYDSFSGNLEGTPHAAVHNSFGFTGGWMGSIDTAAQDPIFFLHHCNIDRIWNAWLAQGGGRTDPLSDTEWTTKKFTFFDENGSEVTMTGCDILRAQEQLGYGYQGEPPQVKLYCKRRLPWWVYIHEILIKWPPIKWPPGPDPGPIEIDLHEVRRQLATSLAGKNAGVALRLDGVTADRQPNVYWEVYMGLPAGEHATIESPHYIGNLAIFGGGVAAAHGGHAAQHAAGVTFSINRALRATLARGHNTALSLQFVARGAGGKQAAETRNNAQIHIGEAAISVRQLKEQHGG